MKRNYNKTRGFGVVENGKKKISIHTHKWHDLTTSLLGAPVGAPLDAFLTTRAQTVAPVRHGVHFRSSG